MSYGEPSLQDLLSELKSIHRDLGFIKEEMAPKLVTLEHGLEAMGWSSLKADLKEIKKLLSDLALKMQAGEDARNGTRWP